ncbi:MAG: phospholipase [Rhodoferax sp.]|nr:phospholipase [Rhodoferax sp.]
MHPATSPSRSQSATANRTTGWPTGLTRWLLAVTLAWAGLSGCASLPSNVDRPVSQALTEPETTALGRLVKAQAAAANAGANSGFRLLSGAERAYTSRLALVEAAEKTLDLQYYAIHADASTDLIIARLREAAQRGVRVRILVDDFHTVGPDAQVLQLAFEPNIAIRLFNPLPGSRSSLMGRIVASMGDLAQAQRRMHNKLFIADNTLGIAGGRNLGDAYFGQGQDSNFVDLDVLAAGPIVRDLSRSFDSYWNNPLAYPVQTLMKQEEITALKKKPPTTVPQSPSDSNASTPVAASLLANAPNAPSASPASPAQPPSPPAAPARQPGSATATTAEAMAASPLGALAVPSLLDMQRLPLTWAPALMMADKPSKIEGDLADPEPTLVDGLLGMMQRARRDVLIVSPYFVPGDRVMGVLAAMRARGVRIRVLTNSLASNDAPLAHAGYARYRERLLAIGVELYEMRTEQEGDRSAFGSGSADRSLSVTGSDTGRLMGGSRASLHTKAVVFDERVVVIGSMNLDLRSELQNSEVALLMRSPALAQQATRLIDSTMQGGAYRLESKDGTLIWHAPQGSKLPDSTNEPDATLSLRLLLKLVGPLAPEEML